MVGVVMKKHNTAIFDLVYNTVADAIRCGIIFPVQTVNIRNKSKEFDSIVIVLKICYNILK